MTKKNKQELKTRTLLDLVSVGPATILDLKLLGISTVEQLATQNGQELYQRLCKKTGERHDPCVEDVFSAAIAQAKDPHLPAEKCKWWYWSSVRKKRKSKG